MNLKDRMMLYENVTQSHLMRKTPVIIRIDGKAFHTFCKGLKKPFDDVFMDSMIGTAEYLCHAIQGCCMGYTQSDEISLLLTDLARQESEPWLGYRLQKIVSVSASLATLRFNQIFAKLAEIIEDDTNEAWNVTNEEFEYARRLMEKKNEMAAFDSRAFNLPPEEVCNYFIGRQRDATRNSIQMAARALFPHQELKNKNCSELQDMMMLKHNVNWNNYTPSQKRGTCIIKQADRQWKPDLNTPEFSKDREYIERLL